MTADECRPAYVDGEVVSIRGGEPMNAEDQEIFGGVIRSAKARLLAERAAHDAEVWDEGVEAYLSRYERDESLPLTNPYRPAPEPPTISRGDS
ncbi:hypothetical protein [Cryobacterium sp. Y57]|uniref:hypothetical protein n=1 Tax=Cryobacterium sp. Y57 TaxID=2048287 RepID=UPI000CE3FC3E|nr:hypothetical protein [Cryobacterium sp. Y57]